MPTPQDLLNYFDNNPDWIIPDSYKSEIVCTEYAKYQWVKNPDLEFVFKLTDATNKSGWYMDHQFTGRDPKRSATWVLINSSGENSSDESLECYLKLLLCRKLIAKFKHLLK